MDNPECQGKWRPGPVQPHLCRWWVVPPKTIETAWVPFCCHSQRLDKHCPTNGHNPYPSEDDGWE